MDSEVQGRYGTMVYVRCGGEGARKPAAKPRAPAKPKACRRRHHPHDNLGVGWQFRHDPLSRHLMGLISQRLNAHRDN